MRNDFLGLSPLAPFEVAEGCYMGYYDPHKRKTREVWAERDARAMARLKVKRRAGKARRAVRYEL